MAGNGGPWGSGGGSGGDNRGGDNRGGDNRGGRKPGGDGPQIPEIEDIVKKGQEQLRVLMGGRGRGNNNGGGGGGGGLGTGPLFTRQGIALAVLAAAGLWAFMSFYTVRPEERSVELFLGKFSAVGNPGLNFAPWPVVKAEIVQVTGERQTDVGTGRDGDLDTGLMLTRDQNIVDIEFQVVWNITDPAKYLFNLADPTDTIKAVSESAMRDIIARSELSPILNRDRGVIASDLRAAVQGTLDSYNAGINVVRVNLGGAIFCSQAAVPHLKRAGGGVIVHISSINALRPQAGALVYAATKAGLTSITQSMARELAPDGIRVVAIAPGDIALDNAPEADAAMAAKGAGGDVANQTPLGRGRTADIGEVVAFVCSPGARFVTGVTWVVDGGLLA